MERKRTSEIIFKGKIIEVRNDTVLLDDGKQANREIVHHSGGVCIALEDENQEFILIEQYRYALQEDLLEFCAGKLEEGENPELAAIREAQEETGYQVKELESLGYMIPTCGYCDEKIYLFHGKLGSYVGQNLDEEEKLCLHRFSLASLNQLVDQGKIVDAKTICILYHLNRRRT